MFYSLCSPQTIHQNTASQSVAHNNAREATPCFSFKFTPWNRNLFRASCVSKTAPEVFPAQARRRHQGKVSRAVWALFVVFIGRSSVVQLTARSRILETQRKLDIEFLIFAEIPCLTDVLGVRSCVTDFEFVNRSSNLEGFRLRLYRTF